MKISPSVKFHISSIKNAIVVFYIVIVATMGTGVYLTQRIQGVVKFGDISFSSIIFLFVIGIMFFRTPFNMLMQSSMTRKELWKSFIISSLIISAFMSAIDTIMAVVSSFIISDASIVSAISGAYTNNAGLSIINTFFLQLFLYMISFSSGYFIRLIYYRGNNLFRVIISVFVPTFLLIGLPVLETYVFIPMNCSLFSTVDFLVRAISPANILGLLFLYVFLFSNLALLSLFNKLLIKRAEVR
ncbi:MAG: hypothetical protein JXN65_08315 [Clostridia bacterium]|nr:hypothetical protein [Clostridia bacterium]